MKKFLLVLTLIALALPALAAVKTAPKSKFKDLTPKNSAYPYVMRMVVSYEAMSGFSDKTFRPNKAVTRTQLRDTLIKALSYLEKKYGVTLSKELNLTASAKPATRFDLATGLGKALKAAYAGFEAPFPTAEAVKFKDVNPKHRTINDIAALMRIGVLTPPKDNKFYGDKAVSRAVLATAGARLIEKTEMMIAALPPKEMAKPVLPPPPSRVERALQITSKPQACVSGGGGNVYERGSGTNNWMNLFGSATYSDIFSLWRFSGNYELTGRYGMNQINYITPGSGGTFGGGLVNENRYEIELNTIYPVVDIWGVSGKLLLGAKYINLSNPVAPSNFTGFNAGLVTSAKAFGRNLLVRGFYSLPLLRASVSPSILGQPSQLFDYEASIDADLLSYPVLLGFSGETMTLAGGASRYYNTFFARYFLF